MRDAIVIVSVQYYLKYLLPSSVKRQHWYRTQDISSQLVVAPEDILIGYTQSHFYLCFWQSCVSGVVAGPSASFLLYTHPPPFTAIQATSLIWFFKVFVTVAPITNLTM
jgi:hypothetical protein